MTGLSEGDRKSVKITVCITRHATVMPNFRDSCKGQFTVTRISKLGISAVEKETGDITSIANKIMWDKKRFINEPQAFQKLIKLKRQK